MIRRATTKDIPTLTRLLLAMINDMSHNQGCDYFDHDKDQRTGGVMEYVSYKVSAPNSIVLVEEDKSFLIGMIEPFPGFLRHRLVGFLEYLYPMTFSSAKLVKVFTDMVKEMGATALICLHYASADKLKKIYLREGFAHMQNLMVKEI